MSKHVKACQRQDPNKTKYRFIKLDDEYICLFGCRSFIDKPGLCQHYVTQHYDDVKVWGMSAKRLTSLATVTTADKATDTPNYEFLVIQPSSNYALQLI